MADDTEEPLTLIETIRGRWRVFAAAGVLAVLAVGGSQVWRMVDDRVSADPRYRITAEAIETTPQPAWVRSDVRSQVLQSPGMSDALSALDPPAKLETRLIDAFQFHPWVRSVGKITKHPPNRIQIELTYRVPLVAVNDASQPGELLLADADAIRLPEKELTASELRHLPRVTLPPSGSRSVNPLLGEPWADPRVRGAVSIAAALGDAWWNLRLAAIVPSRMEVRGSDRYFVYELLHESGTRIVWGAAPSAAPVGEPAFQDKLNRLVGYVQANGPLDVSLIDVRSPRVHIEPRTAQEKKAADDEVLK